MSADWATITAASHRAHVDTVRSGIDVRPMALAVIEERVVPVIAGDLAGIEAGLLVLGSAVRGRHVRGIIFHGAGTVEGTHMAYTFTAPVFGDPQGFISEGGSDDGLVLDTLGDLALVAARVLKVWLSWMS